MTRRKRARRGLAASSPAALAAAASPVHRAGAAAGDPCPCGSGRAFGACCGPVLEGEPAPTAEALMRSRYTAFATGDEDHLFRTWWPSARPDGPYCHPGTRWTGLTIIDTVDGGADAPDGAEAVVEFAASYEAWDGHGGTERDAMHERSLFRRRHGRWLYVEAL